MQNTSPPGGPALPAPCPAGRLEDQAVAAAMDTFSTLRDWLSAP